MAAEKTSGGVNETRPKPASDEKNTAKRHALWRGKRFPVPVVKIRIVLFRTIGRMS